VWSPLPVGVLHQRDYFSVGQEDQKPAEEAVLHKSVTYIFLVFLTLCSCSHFGQTLGNSVDSLRKLNYENYQVLLILHKLVEGLRGEDIELIKSCFDGPVAAYEGYLQSFLFQNCEDLNVAIGNIDIFLLEEENEIAHSLLTDWAFDSKDSVEFSVEIKRFVFRKETFEESMFTAQVFFDYEVTGNCEELKIAGVLSSGKQILQLTKNGEGKWKIVSAVSESKRKGLF